MKLLLVLEDLATGGAQAHAVDLALGLRARGWGAEVLVLGDRVAPAQAARLGPGVSALGQRGLARPAEWGRLVREIGSRRPDVTLSVNQVAGCVVAASRVGGALAAPAVSVLHSTAIGSAAGWMRTAPYLLAARAHDRVVLVSERQRAHWAWRGLGGAGVRVIRNGVDLRRFRRTSAAERAAAKRALGLDGGALTFGSAAMFRPEKNHGQMLEALAALRRDGLAAQLVLVGDGPTHEAAQARARALDLGGAVRFCGEQADVMPYLAALDAGLLCSTAIETSPLFAMELMATGAPLVASRLGGLDELVEDGVDGLLYPRGDTPALLRQLKRCAAPASLRRLSDAAFAKAQTFGLEAMVEGYGRLFEGLASAGARAAA